VTLASGLVTPLSERTDFFGSTWTESDEIVFTRDRKLWRVAATGGVATAVPTPKSDSQVMAYPHALPDSDHVLVELTTPAGNEIALASLSSGALRTLVNDAELPIYSPSGHLVFLRAGSLTAVRFDVASGQTLGDQVPVMDGLPVTARAAAVSLSSTGTLVYVGTAALQSQLVWVNREGAERPLTKASRQYANPRVSPDGRRVLTQTLAGELWVHDVQRETLSRLATPIPLVGFPLWMPNGREILFKSSEGIHRLEVDGGRHSHVAGSIPNDYPSAISADGKTVAVTRLSGTTSGDIYFLSLTGAHEPRAWLVTPAYDGGASWSPDGAWLVYSSTESGSNEVYLQPYPGPGVRRQVSIDGGSHPIWSRDGRELFYRQNSRMFAVSVTRAADDLTLSQPRLLFDRLYGFGQGISIPNYDASADAREFAFVKDAGATHLNVILNWSTELTARTGPRTRR
jgi:eukaryotic-like serine/threonine-protein kinase